MRTLSLLGLLLALVVGMLLVRSMLQQGDSTGATGVGDGASRQAEEVRQSVESSLDKARERLTQGIGQAGAE